MNFKVEYRRLPKIKGISLESAGLTEVALSRADAILAVNLLRNASVPILGGDVYFRTNSGVELVLANWYSNPADGEDRDSFITRSCLDTMNYIESFPSTEAEPISVLVTKTAELQ